MEESRQGSLIYAGIDEAGYGPPLGPLCVGLSVFRIASCAGAIGSGDPPDLWKRLKGVVCKNPQRALRSTIPINDSKALKLSNAVRTRRPLEHLELGVLSFLASTGRVPQSDLEFIASLGVSLEDADWFRGDGPTPVDVDFGGLRIQMHGRRLAQRLAGRGIELASLQCRAVCEGRFNDGVRRLGSKAEVSFEVVASLLRSVLDDFGPEAPFVAIDRQGGRRRYAAALARAFPEASIETMVESARASRYVVSEGERRLTAHFEVSGDSRHLPTALASMTAKLVRETAMARFNEHWMRECPEIGWTAGYGRHALDWLAQLETHMGSGVRARLQRIQ